MSSRKSVTNAYFWSVTGQWGMRLIGVTSALVLVRLIEPDAFGLVALAAICIGFFEAIKAVAVERYLLARTELHAEAMNSAWTLNIIVKFTICCALVLSSSFLASYFNEARLELLIKVIAINNFFSAFRNIGVVRLQKDLDFKKIAKLDMIAKFVSTIITISLAYYYRNYWALVIGTGVGMWVNLIGSYYISSFRPKVSFKFEKELFSFSFYILIRSILGYTRSKVDTFYIGKMFNTSSIGMYKVSMDFALLPFEQVISPAGRVLFPKMSDYKNHKSALFEISYRYLAVVYAFIFPTIFGIFIISEQFCTLILGEKWSEITPIMSSLSILMVSYPIVAMSQNFFDLLGHFKLSVVNDLFGLVVFIVFIVSFNFSDIFEFSYYRAWISIAMFVFVFLFLRISIEYSLSKILPTLAIPFFSSIVMFYMLEGLFKFKEITFMDLILNVIVGAIIYTITILILILLTKHKLSVWSYWYEKINSFSRVIMLKYK